MNTDGTNDMGVDVSGFSWDGEQLDYPSDPQKQTDGKTKTAGEPKSTTVKTEEGTGATQDEIEFRTEMEKHFAGETSEDDVQNNNEEGTTESETEPAETNKEPEQDDLAPLKEVMSILEENGLADFDEEDLNELDSDDKIVDLLSKSVQQRIDSGIENYLSRVPESVANIVKIALNDGDVHGFIKKYYSDSKATDLRSLDLTKEENQVVAMRTLLREEGYPEGAIETQIDMLKDTNQLESMSTIKVNVWSKNREQAEAAELKRAQDAKIQQKMREQEMKKAYNEIVEAKDGISGVTFTPKEKKSLASYVMDRSISLEGGGVVSPFEAQLKQVFADPGQTAVLAKLLMKMKNNKFDFSFLEKKAKTEATKSVRTAFTRSKTKNNKSESLMGDDTDFL